MFALLVLTICFLGVVLSHPGVEYNYLPPNTPFRNEALFNGAAHHVQGSSSNGQNQYQAQNNINQYQQNRGYSSQQQRNGFQTVGYADQAGFGPQSTDVYKSLYYFDSPEDIDIPTPRFRYANEGKSSKHYKIIFIKAPGYVQQPITDIQANVGAAGGGRTIIYVLSKKPEAQQDVVINTGAAEQAVSKPEVYYIKYSSKQDAEQQISQSLNGQQAGGAIQGKSIGSDQEFIFNIKDSIDVRAQGPIIKNLGTANNEQTAPQGAQILGFNQQVQNGGTSSQGYSNGLSTLAPSGYSGGSTGYSTVAPHAAYGGSVTTTDSYGNQQRH